MVRTRPNPAEPVRPEASALGIRLVVHEPPDIQAFAALYHTYLVPVYHYCARRLPTPEDAEDATSLVFTKAFATLPTQRDPSSLRAWLFAIAHNVVADHYRARKPTLALTEIDQMAADEEGSPETATLATEAVRSLLAQLPGEQARIVELRLAGLTSAEIAQVLGKRLNTVKVTQFRAYARLRELIHASTNAYATRAQGESA